jgi:N-acetylglutamate synthase-like GNAT family acetyltransferase
MSFELYRVRRATVDDLPALQKLWAAISLPNADLERRLTEFQVIESDDGQLMGALALEVSGRHGRLHSEAFADFALADNLREQLWARMQSVAENLGLARIWTGEVAPFWKRNGLQPASKEALNKLPAPWQSLPCHWLTLQLRDEAVLEAALEKKFTFLEAEERRRQEETLRKARALKNFGVGLTVIVVVTAIFLCVYLLMHRRVFMRH